jgi:hypothetical protein
MNAPLPRMLPADAVATGSAASRVAVPTRRSR